MPKTYNFRSNGFGEVTLISFPVWAIPCLVKKPIDEDFDILMVAVLKLFSLGYCNTEKLSVMLDLENTIIEAAISNLFHRKLIKDNKKLTEFGEVFLKNNSTLTEFEDNYTYGHMFSFCIDGEVLPYFHENDLPDYTSNFSEDKQIWCIQQESELIHPPGKQKPYYEALKMLAKINKYNRKFDEIGFLPTMKDDSTSDEIKIGNFIVFLDQEKPQLINILATLRINPDNASEYIVSNPFDQVELQLYSKKFDHYLALESSCIVDGKEHRLSNLVKSLHEKSKPTFSNTYENFILEKIPKLKGSKYYTESIKLDLKMAYEKSKSSEEMVKYRTVFPLWLSNCLESILNSEKTQQAESIERCKNLIRSSNISPSELKYEICIKFNISSFASDSEIKKVVNSDKDNSIFPITISLIINSFYNESTPFASILTNYGDTLIELIRYIKDARNNYVHGNNYDESNVDPTVLFKKFINLINIFVEGE